ncbi:hypothetical protein LCGC14_2824920, partial [marine sediment metagenome]
MPEINLFKAENINIDLPKKESSSVANFSFATIPGTGSAAGFSFTSGNAQSHHLEWSIQLRFVNGSNENIIINQINCKFTG